ncbi:MAG TPA: hypothetical protein VER14_09440 [Phototrophicaceae bacterium]|nr:hypothetical protein [Phototrophicaceae bacterium]
MPNNCKGDSLSNGAVLPPIFNGASKRVGFMNLLKEMYKTHRL